MVPDSVYQAQLERITELESALAERDKRIQELEAAAAGARGYLRAELVQYGAAIRLRVARAVELLGESSETGEPLPSDILRSPPNQQPKEET